ncbi:MAG: hypothetical protein IH849_14685, partial [Acidobacteria bacterium]|nr:hypothetical protein [Acidobacteriota bacterium]
MEVDRRVFLATLGVGALELMSPEDKAEALEHYMEGKLDTEIAARAGTVLDACAAPGGNGFVAQDNPLVV